MFLCLRQDVALWGTMHKNRVEQFVWVSEKQQYKNLLYKKGGVYELLSKRDHPEGGVTLLSRMITSFFLF